MPVFDEDYGQSPTPKPGSTWGSPPEMEDTPLNRALLKGFETIGQPIPKPGWMKEPPEPEAPDFNINGYQMPKQPDTSDMYKLGGTNQANASGQGSNLLNAPYKPETSQYVSSQRVPDALGENWEDDGAKTVRDFVNQVSAISKAFQSGRHDPAKTITAQSATPKLGVQIQVAQAAAPASTSATTRYSMNPDDQLLRQKEVSRSSNVAGTAGNLVQDAFQGLVGNSPRIDDEFIQYSEAFGMGDLGGKVSDAISGAVKDHGQYATHVTHGDHAAQGLVNIYQSDPVRFSSDSAAPRIADENTFLELYRESIDARGVGILEDGDHLYQGLNIKKDEFTLGLMEFKLFTDSIMAKIDPHFVADNTQLDKIRDLRSRIAEAKKPDPVQENRDLGETLQALRKGFWKDAVGQKLVDAGIFLTTRNVSLGVEGVYQALKTMSEVHANDALVNGGEGSLLRAFDVGGAAAMKVGAFNKYMRFFSGKLTGANKLLLDYIVSNMSDDMKRRIVDRARMEEVPTSDTRT